MVTGAVVVTLPLLRTTYSKTTVSPTASKDGAEDAATRLFRLSSGVCVASIVTLSDSDRSTPATEAVAVAVLVWLPASRSAWVTV